ncbi:hypothetical protein [Paracoccus sp. TOH]|uniref:Uncharacterized protein n=1 Tax=Paracoccus simplex TaxID=2086346 RepID=A0ABV7S1M9_9RHOB|nr:hypothetical protein [Paracoccus sp. TOH]WJS86266.1 hypothetical protein NBE95_12800 [Paracoccus sp. TOH]
MFRNRQHLFVAAGMAVILTSVALAEQVGRAVDTLAEPAAQAASQPAPPRVGDRLDKARLHQVTRPGLYGMSLPPAGSLYGIVDGKLIRYNPENAQILSIIRQVDRIMD